MRILHLEDSPTDATLVQLRIRKSGIPAQIVHAGSGTEFLQAVKDGPFDVVLVDNALPDFDSLNAIKVVKESMPDAHIVVCSGAARDKDVSTCLSAGASDYVLKDHLWQLSLLLQRLQAGGKVAPPPARTPVKAEAAMRLVQAVQELSMALSLAGIVDIVRRVARELTGADGATFVLRDNGRCYYVDENAISPLWKGQRFPMEACISGWAMMNAKSAVIPDIYADPRIPADAYRPTFVKSLAMVPIRTASPIGAIGNYWAQHHECTPDELYLLEALANTTSLAMENVRQQEELETRVLARTAELQSANDELEAFSSAVTHDLRAPLRAMLAEADALSEQTSDARTREGTAKLKAHGERMQSVISDLLRMAQVGRAGVSWGSVDLSAIAEEIVARLRRAEPDRRVETSIEPGLVVEADAGLMTNVLENLLSNAWKYSGKRAVARVTLRADRSSDVARYIVEDNGAGFDPKYAERLFKPFQRLHSANDFPGTGVGLATVQRIIAMHGGTIRAESAPGQGARFIFTVGSSAATQ
jgi:signal transduction histidine kinase/CheY-like chemotaxis protein